jgi:sec-independent protein translocase protein TatC
MSTEAVPMGGDEGRMTLVDHLTELRSRLIKSVLAVVGGAVIAFIFYPQIFEFLIQPYQKIAEQGNTLDPEGRLILTDPLEGFSVRLRVAGYGGIFLAMPVVLWQIWRFVTPGPVPAREALRDPVRAQLHGAVPARGQPGVLHAAAGARLPRDHRRRGPRHRVLPGQVPPADHLHDAGLRHRLRVPDPADLPAARRRVQPQTLAAGRRYAIVGVVILVAVITPSGDPYSLLMLSVPMVVFYEVSILIGKLVQKRRAAAGAA